MSGSEQITVKDYSDWKLNPKYFEILSKLFVKHDLDAFTTASNSQVAIYYFRDINALKQEWKHQRLWINPPWELLPKIIAKLKSSKAKATVICLAKVFVVWRLNADASFSSEVASAFIALIFACF